MKYNLLAYTVYRIPVQIFLCKYNVYVWKRHNVWRLNQLRTHLTIPSINDMQNIYYDSKQLIEFIVSVLIAYSNSNRKKSK